MNYESFADLANTIRCNLHKVPIDTDLIVGIPRSGMLPASMLAMNLNITFCDINALLYDTELMHGQTRKARNSHIKKPSDAKKIIIIDDSIDSGSSLQSVKEEIAPLVNSYDFTYVAVYATHNGAKQVDLHFKTLKQPRFFEWNLMHRPFLSECCVDIDGVLCVDPTPSENDDGNEYRKFLENAMPLVIPSHPIGHLVTSRLEKYRTETVQWLDKHGVQYEELHMLDLPDAATRRQLDCHSTFKAKIYKELKNTKLFIESESLQAQQITQISGKHALCFSTQQMYNPNFSYASVSNKTKVLSQRVAGKLQRVIKSALKHE